VPARKRRSPQEKKRLSYSRDRRNYYGENDKSSRKNIARHKRRRHRAERHSVRQHLAAATGPADVDAGTPLLMAGSSAGDGGADRTKSLVHRTASDAERSL
jgi:hypothetical protein